MVGSAFAVSPRIVAVAMFSLNEFYDGSNRTGNHVLHIVNILGFFVTGVSGASNVQGVLVTDPALKLTGISNVSNEAAWLKVFRLVK